MIIRGPKDVRLAEPPQSLGELSQKLAEIYKVSVIQL